MTQEAHLTEAERQCVADDTLAPERTIAVHAHLGSCAACAADVARLRAVVQRTRHAASLATLDEDLWPSIRERIVNSKSVELTSSTATLTNPTARRPWLAVGSTVIAAGLLIAALAEIQRSRVEMKGEPPAPTSAAFASVVDSSRMYEDESRRLLNELEMQRAMMPPSASESLDDDLRTIDRSIAELREAIARDPHNLVLQRLLAASYRQKVELLERANNAG